jgi:hypothetical protein
MISLLSTTVKRHGWEFMPEGAHTPASNNLSITALGTALSSNLLILLLPIKQASNSMWEIISADVFNIIQEDLLDAPEQKGLRCRLRTLI